MAEKMIEVLDGKTGKSCRMPEREFVDGQDMYQAVGLSIWDEEILQKDREDIEPEHLTNYLLGNMSPRKPIPDTFVDLLRGKLMKHFQRVEMLDSPQDIVFWARLCHAYEGLTHKRKQTPELAKAIYRAITTLHKGESLKNLALSAKLRKDIKEVWNILSKCPIVSLHYE